MRIIAGLGNPGRRYERTRHNMGYRVADELARRWSLAFSERRFHARLAEGTAGTERLLLMKPETYVNSSGLAVVEAVQKYKCSLDSLLIICDDFNLSLGRIKIARRGSAGGHKGLASVIQALDSAEFPRLRLGIGKEDQPCDRDFVLSRFEPEEESSVQDMTCEAAEAASAWIQHDIEYCMNLFNQRERAQDRGQ